MKEKIEELESIRGLAALLVVLFHIPIENSYLDIGIIKNGYLMVDLFFILSGFVIYHSYSEKIFCAKDLFVFQFLRFFRLYPVHFLFLIAFLLMDAIKYYAAVELKVLSIKVVPFSEYDLYDFIQEIFLIQAIIPYHESSHFNGPAWSISVEFYTYLIFGSLMLCAKNRNVYYISGLTAISVILLSTNTTFGSRDLIRCFAGFFAGCITAMIIRKSTARISNSLSLIVFLSIVLFLEFKPQKSFDLAIYILTPALIFSIVIARNGILNKMLTIKILTWLGEISYSIYMSHFLIIVVIAKIIIRIFKSPVKQNTEGSDLLELPTLEAIGCCFLIIICVLLVSHYTYKIIEKPLRDKSRQRAFNNFK